MSTAEAMKEWAGYVAKFNDGASHERKTKMKTSENTVLVVREHPTDTDYLRWTVQTLGGEIVEDRLTYGQAVSRRDELIAEAAGE